MKRLVLVGGGHAHLSVLQVLAREKPAGVDVVLVTPSPYQSYSGMLPGWIAGHYSQAQCQLELSSLAHAAGARLKINRIVGMDADRRCVGLPNGRHIEYDFLSLDVGSEIDVSWLELLGDKLLPVRPLDNFFEAWPWILDAARHKPDYRLVVVGGGAAGVEIAMAAQYIFSRNGIDARVDLVVSDSGLLVGHADGVKCRVKRLLTNAGVVVYYRRAVGTEEGVLLPDGNLLPADSVIAATGARAHYWLALSKLMLDENGYIAIDGHHRSLSHPNVFAAGDACARHDVALARSGVHAVQAGPVLAANLMAALSGRKMTTYQPRRRSLYLLACGRRYAVASWGRWSAEGEWVWRWKDWIDRRFIERFTYRKYQHNLGVMEETS